MEDRGLLSEAEQRELEAKAQKLLEEKDADAKTRTYPGPFGVLITVMLCVWAAFQLYYTTFGVISAVNLRAVHCFFLLMFTFLLYPAYRSERRRLALPPLRDVVLILLAALVFGYLILNYTRIAQNGGRVSKFELVLACGAMLLTFEAARRASGNLAFLALVFLAYNWFGRYIPGALGHNGFTFKRILTTLFWSTQGVLGTGIGVSATYIFLFVVFGSFLKYSGFSRFINDFSLTLLGQSPGGPAKVSVVASALMGMINGSAIANVATTGTITIPLMKQTGYKKEFAGAVEAVASTGGQFCPPIMGAVGFVMAEFLGLSYTKVMLAAVIPAFLYYLGLLFAVHFEAKRLGLSGLAKENIPDAAEVVKKQGHLVIPLFVLIGLMLMGRTPLYSAVVSIFATVAASWLRKDTRMTWDRIVAATVEGARGAVSVGVCCVIIGVIIGTVTLTSLGLNMGYMILSVVKNNNIYLTGLLVMIMSTILGMGVPGVAAYVIVQAAAAPVLIGVGVPKISAHMFCLIYACLSNITPPVAMSSYVAAGIAGANQTKTGLLSVRLGLVGFLIPFFFLGNPILLIGAGPSATAAGSLWAAFTASAGTVALAGGLEGWFLRRCSWLERLALLAVAPLMLYPGAATDAVGFAVLAAILAAQWMAVRAEKRAKAPAPPEAAKETEPPAAPDVRNSGDSAPSMKAQGSQSHTILRRNHHEKGAHFDIGGGAAGRRPGRWRVGARRSRH